MPYSTYKSQLPGRGPGHRQQGFVSSRQALVLLALLFLSPVLVAWFMHMSGEEAWRPGGTTNRGTLIEPPRPLTLPAAITARSGEGIAEDYLRGKWTLLYIEDGNCSERCEYNLYKMRQVRLSQGENLKRVQRLFLVTGTIPPESLEAALQDHPNLVTGVLTDAQAGSLAPLFAVDGVAMQGAGRIYLVDPLGNLMMYYQPEAEPRGMIKDLKRLLKYSRIG